MNFIILSHIAHAHTRRFFLFIFSFRFTLSFLLVYLYLCTPDYIYLCRLRQPTRLRVMHMAMSRCDRGLMMASCAQTSSSNSLPFGGRQVECNIGRVTSYGKRSEKDTEFNGQWAMTGAHRSEKQNAFCLM